EEEGTGLVTRPLIRDQIARIEVTPPDSRNIEPLGSVAEMLCIPRDRGIRPRVNVSSLGVEHHLVRRSQLFDQAFSLELPHVPLVDPASSGWDFAGWFEHDEVRRLREELDKVGAPSDPLARRVVAEIRALLDAVLADDRLALLIVEG